MTKEFHPSMASYRHEKGFTIQGDYEAIHQAEILFSRLRVLEQVCGWTMGKPCKCNTPQMIPNPVGINCCPDCENFQRAVSGFCRCICHGCRAPSENL